MFLPENVDQAYRLRQTATPRRHKRHRKDLRDVEKKKLLSRLQKQRRAINGDEFPIYQSLIGYNLFLLLCHYELRGEIPRLKDIYVELERSQGGVRRLVKSLLDDGWIELHPDGGDRRSRQVRPTPKMQRAITRFVEFVHLGV